MRKSKHICFLVSVALMALLVSIACGGGGGLLRMVSDWAPEYISPSFEPPILAGGTFEDFFLDCCKDGKGGIWMSGWYTGAFSAGTLSLPDLSPGDGRRGLFAHLDAGGEWGALQSFETGGESSATSICRDLSSPPGVVVGGVFSGDIPLAAGSTDSIASIGGSDAFIARVEGGSSSEITEIITCGTPADDSLFDISTDTSGNILIAMGTVVSDTIPGIITITRSSPLSSPVSLSIPDSLSGYVLVLLLIPPSATDDPSFVCVSGTVELVSGKRCAVEYDPSSGGFAVGGTCSGALDFGDFSADALPNRECFLAFLSGGSSGLAVSSVEVFGGEGNQWLADVSPAADGSGCWVLGGCEESASIGDVTLDYLDSTYMGIFVAKFAGGEWNNIGKVEVYCGYPQCLAPNAHGGVFLSFRGQVSPSTSPSSTTIYFTERVGESDELELDYTPWEDVSLPEVERKFKMVVAMLDDDGCFRFIADRRGGNNQGYAQEMCTDDDLGLWTAGWSDEGISSSGEAFVAKVPVGGWLYLWGSNNHGQLGLGYISAPVSSPFRMDELFGWVQAEGGNSYTLGLLADGSTWGFGWNPWGQLGSGCGMSVNVCNPKSLFPGLLPKIKKVSAGEHHCHALDVSGVLRSWGCDYEGSVGDGPPPSGTGYNSIPVTTPVEICSSGIRSFSAGEDYSLALLDSGGVTSLTLKGWGGNNHYQISPLLSHDSLYHVPLPVSLTTPPLSFAFVSAGLRRSAGLTTSGQVYTWGKYYDSDPPYDIYSFDAPLPLSLPSGAGTPVKCVAGANCVGVLTQSGKVYQATGNASVLSQVVFPSVGGVPPVITDISCKTVDALALDSQGNVWKWSVFPSPSPVQVLSSGDFVRIGTGWYNYYAIMKP